MEGNARRTKIIELLREQSEPLTGTYLAKVLGVSRQVIVQDMALLRAQGIQIISTSEGYLLYDIKTHMVKRVFPVKHSTEDIEDELNSIVDQGGIVLNAIVSHAMFGEITVDLMLDSRRSVAQFVKKMKENELAPLMSLTGGEHYHTVEAPSEEILDEIKQVLSQKGYLIKEITN